MSAAVVALVGEAEPAVLLVVGNEWRRLRVQREPYGVVSILLEFRRRPGDEWRPVRFGKMTLGAAAWRQVIGAISRGLEASPSKDEP